MVAASSCRHSAPMPAASMCAIAPSSRCSARCRSPRTCWANGGFMPCPRRAACRIDLVDFRVRRLRAGRMRLRLCGLRRLIPVTWRRLDVHRVFRLWLGRPLLRRELGSRERLLIEMGRHLVALLGGIAVALIGGEQEPLVGLRVILFDADAARVENGEIVLAVGDAAIGGLAE